MKAKEPRVRESENVALTTTRSGHHHRHHRYGETAVRRAGTETGTFRLGSD